MNNHSTSELSEAYIALGANLGDREKSLNEALTLLNAHADIQVLRCSGAYETEPVGYADQPNFLNMAAAVRTSLMPEALLKVMLEIEDQLGRVRTIRNGPRTVDLDLLWMDGKVLDTPLLILPHPRMQERAFVLFPLRDIVPKDEPSGLLELMTKALGKLDGREGIKLWTTSVWGEGFGHTES
ncbi:2-amino-4-hydroxy-6-hydroxymethyldihydropteridine diphosphokinase [Paenibacillus durus]|uniref:2-amino-4-hydroxy-6-hydroxymethyldihydropteridine diphosphokinase n=1 Tax=Paenibacillus durus ATCC 35681 TaxID=1333534 RepID=A0A0F7FDM4_PAEDU|nr:2-amino-4-hydroxy-6-hydroxymethyldihydropteridine diphosphokinase [Paenibacillus durus]AKG36954.1 2-amino-4-hydroxy-6-hydroxymethyldihydropteridine pyrophosphokinase [Paenibacillus durus ATCC 35681]